jgi:hypothetical protein
VWPFQEHVAMSEQNYRIVPMTPKDADSVLQHLRAFFFRQEPLNVCVKLLGESGDEACLELENYCLKTIPEGTALQRTRASEPNPISTFLSVFCAAY